MSKIKFTHEQWSEITEAVEACIKIECRNEGIIGVKAEAFAKHCAAHLVGYVSDNVDIEEG